MEKNADNIFNLGLFQINTNYRHQLFLGLFIEGSLFKHQLDDFKIIYFKKSITLFERTYFKIKITSAFFLIFSQRHTVINAILGLCTTATQTKDRLRDYTVLHLKQIKFKF